MNPLFFGLGLVLLVVALVDGLWTTLWAEGGAGPYTSRLMKWTWVGLSAASARIPRLLHLSGPIILVLTLASWIGFLWFGWAFLFASVEGAIVDTIDGSAVSVLDAFYFTGYTIFTLGNGGFAPQEGLPQVATVLATGSGMLFVTLSVTYVLQVLGAVSQKHAFADGVTSLGDDPATIATTYWNGERFDGLDLHLDSFAGRINTLTANHEAYPILHYFHGSRADRDPVVAIALLEETTALVRFGVADGHRPSRALLKSTRSSIRSYVRTIESLHTKGGSADRSPPAPDLATLGEAGIPTVSEATFAAALREDDLDERRRRLAGLVASHERRWPTRNAN